MPLSLLFYQFSPCLIHQIHLKICNKSELEKRRLHGELTATFQYLNGTYRKAGEGLFSRNSTDRRRSNGHTLKEGKLECDIRKTFHCEGGQTTHRLPRDGCGCPSSVQGHSGQGLVQWEMSLPLAAGWDQMMMTFKSPSNPLTFCAFMLAFSSMDLSL